ncbi:MAG: hypothetical protein OEY67_04200 [Gammaproteobacteria bacterium]|nr:hypothetical protein [Gammaproteobacteria bacterium]
MPPSPPCLLSIVELGGYADLSNLYRRFGYEVVAVASVRKALGAMKQKTPKAIVAEFNFQSDFRDRTSSLESLLAVVQRLPETKVIIFYDQEHAHQLAKLTAVFPVYATLTHPIDLQRLELLLRDIVSD